MTRDQRIIIASTAWQELDEVTPLHPEVAEELQGASLLIGRAVSFADRHHDDAVLRSTCSCAAERLRAVLANKPPTNPVDDSKLANIVWGLQAIGEA